MSRVTSTSIHAFPKIMLLMLLDNQMLTILLGMMSMLTRLKYLINPVHCQNQWKKVDEDILNIDKTLELFYE